MKDATIPSEEVLVDSFKKVVKKRVQFTSDDIQDWIYMDTPQEYRRHRTHSRWGVGVGENLQA